jgi:hypothetical protein
MLRAHGCPEEELKEGAWRPPCYFYTFLRKILFFGCFWANSMFLPHHHPG